MEQYFDDACEVDDAPVTTIIRPASIDSEDEQLAAMGYKPEMKREFTWFAIVSFAFSVTGILAGPMTTFYTPLAAGGPVALIWAWSWGSFGCLCIGLSVAELVSAYPTDGGLYYTVKHVVPSSWVPLMGWIVGWMNLLGQIACIASVDFMLASQITATAALGSDYAYGAPNSHTVAVMMGCLLVHNQGALALAKNPTQHGRTKHIDIQHHFVREKQAAGEVDLRYVPTAEQLADGLTKALPGEAFRRFRIGLGLEER